MNTCYIAQDRNYLTHDIDKACCDGRLYFQGERDLITLDRVVLDGLLSEMMPFSNSDVSWYPTSPALVETMYRDIFAGVTQGSYDDFGCHVAPKKGGCLVGGGRYAVCILPDERTEKLELTCQAEIEIALMFLARAQKHMKRVGRMGVSCWIQRGCLFFELINWILDPNRALRIAFEERSEYALYDVAHCVEVFNEDKLFVQKKDLDVFVRYKQHTYEYRHASIAEKLFMEQTWYRSKTFKGFI